MTKILFVGAYCALNRGDAALRLGAISALNSHIPNLEVTILTLHPEIDSKIYRDYKVIGDINSAADVIKIVNNCIFYRLNKRLGIKKKYDEIIQSYIGSDIIIYSGGDTLSETYGYSAFIFHFLHIWIAEMLNKPMILYAQSIGPFKITKPIARYFLNKSELITVRGKYSYDYIKKLNVENPPIYLTADAGFLMRPAPVDRINEIFSKYNIKKRPLLGISVSPLMAKYCKSKNSYTGLIAKISDYFVEEYNAMVVFVPNVTGPGNADDRITGREIYDKIKNKDNVKIIVDDFSAEEMKGIIGQCDLFIGARMHACIAALSMSVPTLNISYHHKSNDVFDPFKNECVIISYSDLTFEAIKSKIDELWLKKEEIRENLVKKNEIIENLSIQNAEYVKNILNNIVIEQKTSSL